MAPNPYSYAVEKLTTTIGCLAVHPGDVRKRLTSAYPLFCTLTKDNFPPECHEKWEWVQRELTKFGPLMHYDGKIWIGSVENTMNRIKRKTGTKIAKAIYELYWVVSENQEYF